MKVSEIIQILQKNYSPDDSVVIAWWDKGFFPQSDNMTAAAWEAAAEHLDDLDYWNDVRVDLSCELDYWIEG